MSDRGDTQDVWGMVDIVELLTQIRDKLVDIEEHLAAISGDTDDIAKNTGQSDIPVVNAIEEVGRKLDSATLDIISSIPD